MNLRKLIKNFSLQLERDLLGLGLDPNNFYWKISIDYKERGEGKERYEYTKGVTVLSRGEGTD